MSLNPRDLSSVFHVDVTAASASAKNESQAPQTRDAPSLLREMLSAQEKTNSLLEDLLHQMTLAQKQRQQELGNWKQQNPALSKNCRVAAEALSKVQTEFLYRITEEVNDNAEDMLDGEFILSEFVDRYGPRLAHLNSVLQVLSQLSSVPTPANAP